MGRNVKTVVHIAMHTTNIGDGALVKGIQTTLPTDTDTEMMFIDHCITDFLSYRNHKFDNKYVEWLNSNADLLLIGGGGLISSKYSLKLLKPDVLAKVQLPIVVYAVGHNLFYKQTFKHASALSLLITQIRDLGGLFSVRNDGSLQRLRTDIGASAAESVLEVPDPGLFLPVETMFHPQIRPGQCNIVLQLAGDFLDNRFSANSRWLSPLQSKDHRKRAGEVWLKIANVCNKVSAKHDVNFILAPHLHSDLNATADFVSATRRIPNYKTIAGSRLEVAGIFRGARRASGYFDLYRQADLVIGMRGHSLIVAVGVGTPCVGIISHPKIEGFLKDCGLEKWSTHVADEDIEISLLEKISCLMDDSSEWRGLREIALERMVQMRTSFHRAINGLMRLMLCSTEPLLNTLRYVFEAA
jgi:polysaccharide pyruvyl transferase WcaK-like protein